jgi:mRNA interferase MazF
MKQILIKRGDVFWIDFDPSKATEIKKRRPALIVSHDVMNEYSSRVIVAPITSQLKKVFSFELEIKGTAGIKGKILLDQLRTVDKSRLEKKMGALTIQELQEVNAIIKLVLGLESV